MLLKDALSLDTSLHIVSISWKTPLGIGFVNGGRRWGIFSIHLAFVYIFAINRNIEPSILGKNSPIRSLWGKRGEKVGNLPKGPWDGRYLFVAFFPMCYQHRGRAISGLWMSGAVPANGRRRPMGRTALGPRVSSEVLFLQLGSLNVRIDLRGGDIGMPQHFLNGSQVGTAL